MKMDILQYSKLKVWSDVIFPASDSEDSIVFIFSDSKLYSNIKAIHDYTKHCSRSVIIAFSSGEQAIGLSNGVYKKIDTRKEYDCLSIAITFFEYLKFKVAQVQYMRAYIQFKNYIGMFIATILYK